jgi:hypothetical protein
MYKGITPIHRFITRADKRELNAIEHRIAERKSLDFYGKKYSSLTTSQKQHMRAKARRLMDQGARE